MKMKECVIRESRQADFRTMYVRNAGKDTALALGLF